MQMPNFKRPKPPNNEVGTVKLQLHSAYASAVLRATELDIELKTYREKKASLKLQCNRLDSDARGFILNQAMALPGIENELAIKVVRGASVLEEVRAARTVGICADLYSRLRLRDASDLEFIKAFDDVRAAILVLESAVKLAATEVQKQKGIAIKEISQTLSPRRQQIARRVATALRELHTAMAEEKAFGDELRAQDPGFFHHMHPGYFPIRLLMDPEILSWVNQARNEGLIDADYPDIDPSIEVRQMESAV
jgi:hypothetical protein